jgi:hypothetical protein
MGSSQLDRSLCKGTLATKTIFCAIPELKGKTFTYCSWQSSILDLRDAGECDGSILFDDISDSVKRVYTLESFDQA